jgi:hypothetical protein
MLLRNVGLYLQHYTLSQPKGWQSVIYLPNFPVTSVVIRVNLQLIKVKIPCYVVLHNSCLIIKVIRSFGMQLTLNNQTDFTDAWHMISNLN